MHAYSIGGHRHAPEIEQGLSWAAGVPVRVNFTPHLVPMNRGIIESIFVKLADDVGAEDLHSSLSRRYGEERFIHVGISRKTPCWAYTSKDKCGFTAAFLSFSSCSGWKSD